MRTLGLALLILTSGCSLYLGGDDDECPYGGGGGGADVPSIGLRNPQSGQCEYYGPSGPYPCDDRCGPCADPTTGNADAEGAGLQAEPTWGFCQNQCSGLAEADCLSASACRGIYGGSATPEGGPTFLECWSTDQTGPIQGGGCAGLDAYTCSLHDDCIAIHQATFPGDTNPIIGEFAACAAEAIGCFSDDGCPADSHCNADEICQLPPDCGDLGACDAACYGFCVPGPRWIGECWAPAECRSLPPTCPGDTTPGVANGCWTGECIPLADCETPPPACETITSEMSCIARADCTPYYQGESCTCDGDACTCTWLFDSCHS